MRRLYVWFVVFTRFVCGWGTISCLGLVSCSGLPEGWTEGGLIVEEQRVLIVPNPGLTLYSIETTLVCKNTSSAPLRRLLLQKPGIGEVEMSGVRGEKAQPLSASPWNGSLWLIDLDTPLIPNATAEVSVTYTVRFPGESRSSRLIRESDSLLPQLPNRHDDHGNVRFSVLCRDPDGLKSVVCGEIQGRSDVGTDLSRFVTSDLRHNIALYTAPLETLRTKGVQVWTKHPNQKARDLATLIQSIDEALRLGLGSPPSDEVITLVECDTDEVSVSSRTLFIPEHLWNQEDQEALGIQLAQLLGASWIGPYGLYSSDKEEESLATSLRHYLGLRALERANHGEWADAELKRCAASLRESSDWTAGKSERASLFWALDQALGQSSGGAASPLERTIRDLLASGDLAFEFAKVRSRLIDLFPTSVNEEATGPCIDAWMSLASPPRLEFDWEPTDESRLSIRMTGPPLPMRVYTQIWREREPARRWVNRGLERSSEHEVIATSKTFWLDLDPERLWPVEWAPRIRPSAIEMSRSVARSLAENSWIGPGVFGEDPQVVWSTESGTSLRLNDSEKTMSSCPIDPWELVSRGKMRAYASYQKGSWNLFGEDDRTAGRLWIDLEHDRVDSLVLCDQSGSLELFARFTWDSTGSMARSIEIQGSEIEGPLTLARVRSE